MNSLAANSMRSRWIESFSDSSFRFCKAMMRPIEIIAYTVSITDNKIMEPKASSSFVRILMRLNNSIIVRLSTHEIIAQFGGGDYESIMNLRTRDYLRKV